MIAVCKCGNEYEKFTSLQTVCYQCAVEKGRKLIKKELRQREKLVKASDKKRLKELMTVRQHMKVIQEKIFNPYIRERDKGRPCMSCQRFIPEGKKRNAGHFLSVGARPEIRFSPINVWLQCESCNSPTNGKSGNQAEYETHLRAHIGDSLVDLIKAKHPPMQVKKCDVPEFRALLKRLLDFQIEFNKSRQL